METDDISAVTILSSISSQPISPKVETTAKNRGILPSTPAFQLLYISHIRTKITVNAKISEY
ncbi:hypothetical protein RZS08_22510, partial [Arthrospira platensis SPKY1]|nr:hypothetical protein [Arthrospira platensis SPKY1]